MKFVIDRSKWRCGVGISDYKNSNKHTHGKGVTLLLNAEGYMCCLGQVARQIGIEEQDIINQTSPQKLGFSIPILVRNGLNTSLARQAMMINDNANLDRKKREKKLKSLFKKFKHELIFKGKYND